MVGTIQILIAVFKLGDLTRYVSESVILGFMAGAGLLVGIGQVGNFLGAAKKGSGDQSPLAQLWETLARGGPFSFYAVGLGAGTILTVLILRRVINRYKLPQMDMLLGLVAAAGVAAFFGWSIPAANGKSLVAVVGKIPARYRDTTSRKSTGRGFPNCSAAPWRFPSSACWKPSPSPSPSPPTRASPSTTTANASPKAFPTSSAASCSPYPAPGR